MKSFQGILRRARANCHGGKYHLLSPDTVQTCCHANEKRRNSPISPGVKDWLKGFSCDDFRPARSRTSRSAGRIATGDV